MKPSPICQACKKRKATHHYVETDPADFAVVREYFVCPFCLPTYQFPGSRIKQLTTPRSRKTIIDYMNRKMEKAVEDERYEDAAEFRDQILALGKG